MQHSDLIDRVTAIMANSDRTLRARAEEVVALVEEDVPVPMNPDSEGIRAWVELMRGRAARADYEYRRALVTAAMLLE